jgi:uncharacterized membrane protein
MLGHARKAAGFTHAHGASIVSELVVAAYDREDTAAHVLGVLRAHSDELSLDLDSIAIVRVDRAGRFTVTTTAGPHTGNSSWGVLWGALFELVFVVPTAGAAYGPSLGAVFGTLDRAGLDADFRGRVRSALGSGTSGLAFFVVEVDPTPVLDRLPTHPSALVRRSLSLEQDAELMHELGGLAR